jgi:phosphoglycerate dehydrogenase-like enzyme
VRRAVINLTSLRPIWSIPDAYVPTIREAFGKDWEVVHVTTPTSSDGDGSGGSTEAMDAAIEAEVYFGWGISADVVRAAGEKLRWLHTAAAGVGGSLTVELKESGALFTNSRQIHAEPIADWVLAAVTFCARGFHGAMVGQSERRWAKAELAGLDTPLRELKDLKVGLLGLGGIGSAAARRLLALGMEVKAIRRRPDRRRPKGVTWVGGPGDILELAHQSDVFVIAAPQTSDTVSIVDDSVLANLPQGAHVLNVSRGALLDEEALLKHLDSGHLGGCVLDVFSTEPLPSEHLFWEHPKVFVTPHVSCVTHRFWDRETEFIVDNIDRYLGGRRLRNIVNSVVGY